MGNATRQPMLLLALLLSYALLAAAPALTISPPSAILGEFPAWEPQTQMFVIRNTGDAPVNLLRLRSSCSCLSTDFRPCALTAGEETTLAITIPANTVSGDFAKSAYLETDAPGQEVLRLEVGGTASPAVEIRPKNEVYLGRLEAGKPQKVSFRLTPAIPEMSLRLLPADGEGTANASLTRSDDGSYSLELAFIPEASRHFALVRRQVAVDWTDKLPLLELKVRYTVAEENPPAPTQEDTR